MIKLKIISSLFIVVLLFAVLSKQALAWKFAVVGDTRPGTSYDHSQNNYGISFKSPNSSRVLIFENGDLTLDGTDSQWANYRSIISTPLGIPTDNSGWLNSYGIPKIISSVGNHDTHQVGWQTRWQTYLPPQAGLSAYPDIPAHAQGLYGSVKYGNAIFVWVDYYSMPSGQEAFLSNTLSRAKSDTQVIWKFVSYHSPAVSCGGEHGDWGQGKTWHDSYFYPNGVDMIFAGDNHFYERTCPFKGGLVASGGSEQNVCDTNNMGNTIVNTNGVIHVVSGGGGAELYSVGSCPYLAKNQNGVNAAFSLHQFMDIEINGNTLHAVVYDTDTGVGTNPILTEAQANNLQVIDDFTITKAGGPTPTPGGPTATPTPRPSPTPTPRPSSTSTPTPTNPPGGNSYEAEAPGNTLSGTAVITSCQSCSGGYLVGYVGGGSANTLQFNNVYTATSGPYTLTIHYINGDTGPRTAFVSVNSGSQTNISFPATGSWSTLGTLNITVNLSGGYNTIKFGNNTTSTPDFDRIIVVGGTTPTPTSVSTKPGDANGDGKVDDLDYTIWANNYGITNATGPRQGDFNADHKVDDLDYTIWANNYNSSSPTPTPTPTPRPSSTPTPTNAPTTTPKPTLPPGSRAIKYYGVDQGNPVSDANYTTLSQHSVNTVIYYANVNGSASYLQNIVSMAKKYNFKLVILPADYDDPVPNCGWDNPFHKNTSGDFIWEVKPLLDAIGGDPTFIGIITAHEPMWSCITSISDMATIRTQLKDYVRNKFGRDIQIWNYIDNVGDMQYLSDFNGDWTDIGRIMDVALTWQHCFGTQEGSCSGARTKIINDRNLINNAGLDGKVDLVFLFQTFAMGSGYWMPSLSEMQQWDCNFLATGALDGFMYYTWGTSRSSPGGWYDSDLTDHQELWPEMNRVYDNCVVK